MSAITIKKVATRSDLRHFIDFHHDLYEGNPYDVPTLFSDDMNTLSKDKNPAFDFCEADYFPYLSRGGVLWAVWQRSSTAVLTPAGSAKSVRFGWIDMVDDVDVARALLDAVAQFGRERGMTEVVGPLGFTDFDPEGMLTDGFDQLGTMATIYNYPYYPKLMEQLGGWEKDNDYVEFKLIVPDTVPEKYTKVARLVEKRFNLHVRILTRHEILKGGLWT